MGRCYEFGAVIHEGCDHAMVVSPEGGACVCGTCGVACTGRYSGCEAILAIPGHVPLAAPRRKDASTRVALSARAAAPGTSPLPPPVASALLAMPDTQPQPVEELDLPKLAEVVDMFEELLARPDRTLDALSQLRRELAQ